MARTNQRFLDWLRAKSPNLVVLGRVWNKHGTEYTTPQTNGWPDFAIRLDENKVVIYEVKAIGEPVMPSQREILTMLAGLGAKVYVAEERREGGFELVRVETERTYLG